MGMYIYLRIPLLFFVAFLLKRLSHHHQKSSLAYALLCSHGHLTWSIGNGETTFATTRVGDESGRILRSRTLYRKTNLIVENISLGALVDLLCSSGRSDNACGGQPYRIEPRYQSIDWA
jgi:hypothetical protein